MATNSDTLTPADTPTLFTTDEVNNHGIRNAIEAIVRRQLQQAGRVVVTAEVTAGAEGGAGREEVRELQETGSEAHDAYAQNAGWRRGAVKPK